MTNQNDLEKLAGLSKTLIEGDETQQREALKDACDIAALQEVLGNKVSALRMQSNDPDLEVLESATGEVNLAIISMIAHAEDETETLPMKQTDGDVELAEAA